MSVCVAYHYCGLCYGAVGFQELLRGLRFLVAAGLLGWVVWLFVEHQRLHDRGCLSESAWTTKNDEISDRELKVE